MFHVHSFEAKNRVFDYQTMNTMFKKLMFKSVRWVISQDPIKFDVHLFEAKFGMLEFDYPYMNTLDVW